MNTPGAGQFSHAGSKWLVLAYANLRRAGVTSPVERHLDVALGPARRAGLAVAPACPGPCACTAGWIMPPRLSPLSQLLPGWTWWRWTLPVTAARIIVRPAATITFTDYVCDLDAALDALGWHQCVLIGHSMGTGAAVSYACADPSRVSALLLLDGLGLMTEEAPLLPARMARALASVRNPRQHRSVFGAIEEAAAVRMANNPMHAGSAYLLAERALQRSPDGWRWRTDGRAMWTSPAYITEAQSSALMAAVQCPALALYTDTLYKYLGERLAGRLQALPDVQAHKVPGGHHVHMDDPESMAQLIRPFLATLDLTA